jgi:hypothetical protein
MVIVIALSFLLFGGLCYCIGYQNGMYDETLRSLEEIYRLIKQILNS